jgi:putative hydrolase of the HAD superfamily
LKRHFDAAGVATPSAASAEDATQGNRRAISIPGRVIVFDYGEVISIPTQADRSRLTDLAGADTPSFWAAYWNHRDALDLGDITAIEYWRNIQRDLGADWDLARLYLLWLTDFRGWLAVDQGTLDILVDLKHGGTRMALLSNAGPDFTSYYRQGVLGEFFEHVFMSSELGALKPESAVFAAVLRRLNVTADKMVLIDDREVNVRGAKDVGAAGHLFTTAENLREFLEGLARAGSLAQTKQDVAS